MEMAGEGDKRGYSLRVKIKRKNEDEYTEEAKMKKIKIKRRESYKRWKNTLKNDPDKLARFRQEDSAKHKQARRAMNDEQRNVYNEKVRERMRRYRERKKMNEENATKKKTRNQIQKQRQYWREKKRESRSQMSEERKLLERDRRRQKYLETKARKKLDFDKAPKSKRINLPQNPQPFADSVRNLVTKCTPRKQKALKQRGINVLSPSTLNRYATNAKIVANLKEGLKKLKNSQNAREKQQYYVSVRGIVGKHYIDKNIRQSLDLKVNYWRKLSHLQEEPIPVITSVSSETKESIKGFYLDESDYLSSRRNATKKVMTDTLKNAHNTFISQNQSTKVSLSTFIKRRPKQVLTMDKAKFQGCLCEYCVNIEFKLETLNKQCNKTDLKELKLVDKFKCLKITVCETENELEMFKDKQCVDRACDKCGEQLIALHFQPLIEKMGEEEIKWKKWEVCTLKDGKKRQMLIEKEGPVLKLVKELSDELEPFSRHIFTATWQRKQYKKLISNIPEEVAVLLMDFSENYRCLNQDEIQAAYYQYQQATLFPIIAHYRCANCQDTIVQESVVFISPDTKHDNDAAHEFIRVMNDHLKKTVPIKHEIQYSDGCAGQFKSKKPFQYMSEANEPTVEKSFFGSRHGKSLCDSLGGLVKNQAANHVRSRKGTIPDAKALYDFCVKYLTIGSVSNTTCLHKRRHFFYIDSIPRESGPSNELCTVKGTQSFHNVKGVSAGIIKIRKLACFCTSCLAGDGSNCENVNTVGHWETRTIQTKQKKGQRNETNNITKKQRLKLY